MTSTDSPTTAQNERFSDVIRTATFQDHETAAMSGFMTALFQERLPLENYTSMVAQHLFAYEVLESAGDTLADHPIAGPFVVEALRRVPSLEADLQFLLGDEWREQIVASAATTAYVDRMNEVCFDRPEAFVAHHYTRYMGDLSGGQMIGRIARRTYELAPGAGAAFYEFPDIADLTVFKDEYRVKLDQAPLTADDRECLLAEVVVAYALNTDVFTELDADLGAVPTSTDAP